MFRRGRQRDVKEQNGGVPCGQVRVLVVGDSGDESILVKGNWVKMMEYVMSLPSLKDESSLGDLVLCLSHSRALYCKDARKPIRRKSIRFQLDLQDLLCPESQIIFCLLVGVGKTSLVNLIIKGSSISHPPRTIGCSVSLKHITYGNSGSSSSSFTGDNDREFFIEIWDICGHERYKDCRSLFYSQINGVIFVHDLSQRRTKTSVHKWAAEIAINGTFSAPLGSGVPGGLPVPFIVIGNKADVAAKEGVRGSSGNLVDAARQWVEKQGLLPSSEELPLTETFPGNGGIVAAAKESRYDKEATTKFFQMLIRRRYFSDELPAPSPWVASPPQRPPWRLDDDLSEDEQFYKNTSLTSDAYKYNMLPPLPAQRNLTPPPTLYPQQPVAASENYSYPRFSLSTPEISSNAARSKRSDINV